MNNQKGFGAIEALIIVIILGLVGFGGWYIYSRNTKAEPKPINKTSNNTSQIEEKKEPVDTEAQSWIRVESAQKGFSIRIPDGWTVTNYGQSDNIRSSSITYKDGSKASIASIDTPYGGDSLVRFQVIQFKNSDTFRLLDGDEQESPFNVGDLKGTRYYKVYPLEELTGVGPIPGEETYTYEFKTSDKTTYVIYRVLNKNQYSEWFLQTNYNQNSSDPNQHELIERMVRTIAVR